MKKRSRKPKKAKIAVKTIVLAKTEVLQVVVPKGVTPLIVPDPAKGIVEIVPVAAKKGWWQSIFG